MVCFHKIFLVDSWILCPIYQMQHCTKIDQYKIFFEELHKLTNLLKLFQLRLKFI